MTTDSTSAVDAVDLDGSPVRLRLLSCDADAVSSLPRHAAEPTSSARVLDLGSGRLVDVIRRPGVGLVAVDVLTVEAASS